MESFIPQFILDRLGVTGAIVVFLVWAFQYVTPEARKTVLDAITNIINIIKNFPRRWRSETARVKESIAAMKMGGKFDEAAQKEAKAPARVLVRVLSGTLEDVLNNGVDIAYAVLPIVVSAVKLIRKKK